MSAKAKGKRTCLEEAELDEARPAAKAARPLRKQNSEQIVAKAIKDTLGDVTASEIDGAMVEGRTSRQTLLFDKARSALASRRRLSASATTTSYETLSAATSRAPRLRRGQPAGQLRPLQCHGVREEDASEQELRPWANI